MKSRYSSFVAETGAPGSPWRKSRAFTLVELLVVIGIIAVLIGILMPALSQARAQAASIQCAKQMQQIGLAIIAYAQENNGQYPLAEGSTTIERFHEYTTGANPSAIRDAIAVFLGTTLPPYPPFPGTTYAPVAVPVMYCPTELGLGIRSTGTGSYNAVPENFLAEDASTSASNGKFLYWYVANPWDEAVPTTYGNNADLAAAAYWFHMETGAPVADTTRPCTPGIDYLRNTSDPNSYQIAILVDQSRQQQAAGGGWFWMHGGGSIYKPSGWKNELYGDGHVASVHATSVVSRWGLSNPAGW